MKRFFLWVGKGWDGMHLCIVLAAVELGYVVQAGLELREICLPLELPPNWD